MDHMKSKTCFCQSCGMLMQHYDDFGNNSDGSQNNDYCQFCFQEGSFIEPQITMDQMIEKVAKLMVIIKKMSPMLAYEKTRAVVIGLKRWNMSQEQAM